MQVETLGILALSALALCYVSPAFLAGLSAWASISATVAGLGR